MGSSRVSDVAYVNARSRRVLPFGRWLALLLVLSLWPQRGLAEQTLTAAAQQAIESPPNEKPYEVRLHFLRSNERRHDLFFSALAGSGGGYLGVGADQNYTLLAIARSSVVWLVDIDGDVVDWHKIYAALIPQAATPTALLGLLSGRRDPEVLAALAARWDTGEVKRLWPLYLRYRGYLLNHLSSEQQVRRRGVPVTWLSNLELYQYVRQLMVERRLVARVGDLHGERTLLGIADAARSAGVTMGAVYVSNVEQWFRYSPQFRRNMGALPRRAQTVVLRTLARGELDFPDEDRWHFSVETLDDFVARMEATTSPLTSVSGLMPAMSQAKLPGVRGISWIGPVPARSPSLALRPWSSLPTLRP
jgi:hypothetical protein